ncbi:ketopantoate reductase family protein [Rummeliibacillus sp. JY-2-4R]
MKIGIAGAGAVGCLIGSMLQESGHEVTFLARGNHLSTMKKRGLIVQHEEREITIQGHFTDNIGDLSESELILFCVKSNDTERMAKKLSSFINPESVIVTVQNGLGNEEILSKVLSSNEILSCASYLQASIVEPGIVKQQGSVRLVMGEYTPSGKGACNKLVKVFQEVGIDAKHAENIIEQKWKKLLWNITFNPLTAIANVSVGEILDNEELKKTASNICIQSINVALKLGISLDFEKTYSTIFRNAEHARKHQTSMLQDRLNGKMMEVDSMCGVVVKKAEELDVEVPTIQAVYSIANKLNESLQRSERSRI